MSISSQHFETVITNQGGNATAVAADAVPGATLAFILSKPVGTVRQTMEVLVPTEQKFLELEISLPLVGLCF